MDGAPFFSFFGGSIWEEGFQIAGRDGGEDRSVCNGVVVFGDCTLSATNYEGKFGKFYCRQWPFGLLFEIVKSPCGAKEAVFENWYKEEISKSRSLYLSNVYNENTVYSKEWEIFVKSRHVVEI